MSVIEIANLTRRFGEIIAVNELSLEIHQGEIFGILGHNGAGKTTTVRLLNGILSPDSGSARVLDMSPYKEGAKLRARTGVLTETPSLDERLTGSENLRFYAAMYDVPISNVSAKVDEMLRVFGLQDWGNEKVGGYSKGMKQRLALARAFLHEPELIFLDEPTAGLDPISTRQVHDMIQRLSQDEGRTVVICTHNLTEAQRLCQRLAVMEHGRLVAMGTPAELAHQTGRGSRYELEIDANQIEAAISIAHSLDGVLKATNEFNRMTIAVSDRKVIPALLSQFTNSGIRVYQVVQQDASLEDIYFALHGAEVQ